jgi:hypothetical protein
MRASLRALLEGIIDYAGLFPPAALPLDQAIRNYARYRKEPESWMMARFVCPIKQLAESDPWVESLFHARAPFVCSVLGREWTPEEDFVASAVADSSSIANYHASHGDRTFIDTLEVRLPVGIDTARWQKYESALSIFWKNLNLRVFCEVPAGCVTAAQAIGLLGSTQGRLGFKLRCGGVHASAFPGPEQIAFTIAACRDARVPLKFTAGLHHPLRHFNAGVQTHMHGFINVFVAGVLAHARNLTEEQLHAIIEDEDPASFAFTDDELRWKDQRATTAEIVEARKHAVTSFGSCSFDEPRDDLRKLGWLE